jgi:hypothetical protein
VQIAAGQLSATIAVNPVNDTVGEGTETVGATLITDAAYQVGSPSGGTVYLYDNE